MDFDLRPLTSSTCSRHLTVSEVEIFTPVSLAFTRSMNFLENKRAHRVRGISPLSISEPFGGMVRSKGTRISFNLH